MNKTLIALTAIITIALTVTAYGTFFISNNQPSTQPTPIATATTTPTTAPTATPTQTPQPTSTINATAQPTTAPTATPQPTPIQTNLTIGFTCALSNETLSGKLCYYTTGIMQSKPMFVPIPNKQIIIYAANTTDTLTLIGTANTDSNGYYQLTIFDICHYAKAQFNGDNIYIQSEATAINTNPYY